MIELIKFVISSTVLLAVSFGIAWPCVVWAQEVISKWGETSKIRRFTKSGLLILTACVGVVAGVIDILVNYITATIVFQQLPDKGDLYLTQRIQRYLNEMSQVERPKLMFNWYQHLYIKAVVLVANKIDRTPHFKIPKNLNL